MSASRLHHYVPQFHLRRFTDPSGRLWLWDRNEDRVFVSTPKAVAAEKDFYHVFEMVEIGHDPLMLEKQFSDLEGQFALITDQWLGWLRHMAPLEKIEIPTVNREIVSLYIALQFLRTADTRDILAAFVEEKEKRTPLPTEEKRRLHIELLWDDRFVRDFAGRLQNSIWIFARNDTTTPFITSDNPVAFRTGDNAMWLKAGVLSPGTYVVFPLAPDVVMYCCPNEPPWEKTAKFDCGLSPVVLSAGMVQSENGGQVFMASRFVISQQNNFDQEREFAESIGTENYAGYWARRRKSTS